MHRGKRTALASLAAILSIPVIGWLLAEHVVYYEMFATGANSRAELSEDLGLGILLFMVVPTGTLIGVIGVWFFVWFRSGTKTNADSSTRNFK